MIAYPRTPWYGQFVLWHFMKIGYKSARERLDNSASAVLCSGCGRNIAFTKYHQQSHAQWQAPVKMNKFEFGVIPTCNLIFLTDFLSSAQHQLVSTKHMLDRMLCAHCHMNGAFSVSNAWTPWRDHGAWWDSAWRMMDHGRMVHGAWCMMDHGAYSGPAGGNKRAPRGGQVRHAGQPRWLQC